MDTETRSSLNSKSFLYTIKTMHLSDEPYLEGLSDDDASSFMEEHMDADINMDYVDYTVSIPKAIIQKAKEQQ